MEEACPLGYCGWKGEGLQTVGEVGNYFDRLVYQIDQQMGEAGGSRWFINAVDEWSREELLRNLLPEVERALMDAA